MKLLLIILSFTLFLSCQENQNTKPEPIETSKKTFPKNIEAIFNAHGGYETWSALNTMSYEIIKDAGPEKQIIDLKNRQERIEGSNFTMGFDGKNTWVDADTSYNGNPIFYKNLMFYFYAMPFVLGDDGIVYETTRELVVDGDTLAGIKISYNDGVGVSSKDEYFVHYNNVTNEMAWLGYTVTYFSKDKSQKISWIKYDDWRMFDGVKLPQSISWYKTENNLPTEFRNKVVFEKVSVTKNKVDPKTFSMTPGAKIAE